MFEFNIRSASPQESPEIRALIRAVHINPMGLDWRHFLVAVTPNDILLGCGQIKPHYDGSLELASIAVKEQARGQGVAHKVIQELLRREMTRPLYLMCKARLESFYVLFGFQAIDIDEMPPYFRRIRRAERIFNAKAALEDRLQVMRLSDDKNK